MVILKYKKLNVKIKTKNKISTDYKLIQKWKKIKRSYG
jgi:hypothetical protein